MPNGRVCAGSIAGNISAEGYRKIKVDRKLCLAHRLAWLWMMGRWPKQEIDHINCRRDQNQWSNLREATLAENRRNKRRCENSGSGKKGVRLHNGTGKWEARITANGKPIYLGLFKRIEDAMAAYEIAALKYHGDFARAA